eukprot:GEMP01035228.1.p1 GENE.GEMP01035228.1~~GEMP01035228.1.p1  ORF type:complete len:151 (+),score=9.03 GEMP01035228.1:284-736(+)
MGPIDFRFPCCNSYEANPDSDFSGEFRIFVVGSTLLRSFCSCFSCAPVFNEFGPISVTASSFNDSSELRPSVNKARRMAPARSRLSKDFSSAEKKKSFDELRNDASCSDALTLTAQKYSCYSRSWNYRNEVLTPGLLSGNRWRANGLIRQ